MIEFHKHWQAILALVGVLGIGYTLSTRWFRVETAALELLPKAIMDVDGKLITHTIAAEKRDDDLTKAIVQINETNKQLTDAALVKKSNKMAAYKECQRLVKAGRAHLEDCKEPEE